MSAQGSFSSGEFLTRQYDALTTLGTSHFHIPRLSVQSRSYSSPHQILRPLPSSPADGSTHAQTTSSPPFSARFVLEWEDSARGSPAALAALLAWAASFAGSASHLLEAAWAAGDLAQQPRRPLRHGSLAARAGLALLAVAAVQAVEPVGAAVEADGLAVGMSEVVWVVVDWHSHPHR